MRIFTFILIPFLFLSAKNLQTSSEQLVYKGTFVEIYVEKAIYHSSANQNFLMKFIIKNISDKTIGVDLSDYWKVIYPNQWGIYKNPYREVVDEIQIIPDKVIDNDAFMGKYKNNKLTFIKPKGSLEYYRDWNGSGEKIELKNKDEYLIISVDGQILLTDGNDVEHVTLNDAKETDRVVVLNYPVINKTVPQKEMIINKNKN